MTPFTRVNIQFEPVSELLTEPLYRTRTVVAAPSGRMPPSGTTIVWSLTAAATARPSTVTAPRRIAPRRAAIVFRSTRSIGPPDAFRISAVESTLIDRAPHPMRRVASYVASSDRLERLTVPGTIALGAGAATASGAAVVVVVVVAASVSAAATGAIHEVAAATRTAASRATTGCLDRLGMPPMVGV